MGISGLLPLLKEAQTHGHISEFRGKRLAVDAYVWLHKGAFGCAEDLVKGGKTTRFVDYAMHRVRLLRHHGITPFIVFDGGPLPAKKGTEVSRARSRAEHLARAKSAESQGRMKEARDCYTKCVDITPEMAYQLIKALRAEDVEYIVAPYEADAQLCMLEREGVVDGIITEDSDLLVFGCKQVIFKLDGDGNCVNIHRDRLAHLSGAPMHGWTNTEFRRMAMLSGCDYLPSLPGVGIKTAHRLLRRFKSVEKHLRLEGTRVPDDYVASFNQAELAFLHQRIYDPALLTLRPLAPFPEGGLREDDEKWIGLELSSEIAQGLAKGDLHPETYQPIEDQWPDYQPAQRNVNASLSAPSRTPSGPLTILAKHNTPLSTTKSRGPMDAFITRSASKSEPKRSNPALPRPVGVNGSGPSRLSDLVSPSAVPRMGRGEVVSRRGASGGIEAAAAAKRHAAPNSDESSNVYASEKHATVKSKFFGGGTQPTRPVREAPSPAKNVKEDLGLIWEASSEAGPEVEFDETQAILRAGGDDELQSCMMKPERQDELDQARHSMQDGGSSPSIIISPIGSPTTPTGRRTARSFARLPIRGEDDRPRTHTQALTSPGAPMLSSPPDMAISPLRAASPSHRETYPTADMKDEERYEQYSSPPDIGRQRSLTADPFPPSPSPRPNKRARLTSDSEHPPTAVAVASSANVTHQASDAADIDSSQPIRSSTPSYGPPSRVFDSQPLPDPGASREHTTCVGGGWTTGSSDALDDEDIVTPSYDAGHVAGRARNGLLTTTVTPTLREDDEIRASSDEEEGAEERVLQVEVERRKERAQIVSAGWKQRFSLQGPPSAQRRPSQPPAPSLPSATRPIKRRKTDPEALVPPSPTQTPTRIARAGPLSPLVAQPINQAAFPSTSTPLAKVRKETYTTADPSTPAFAARSVKPAHEAQISITAKAISAFAPKTPIPLSACAPRFLSTARLNTQLPLSPAQVKQERERQQQSQLRGSGDVKCEMAVATPFRGLEAGEKREGRSVMSKFRFEGTMPEQRGRSWI